MKPLVFNVDSWHYLAAHNVAGWHSNPRTDNLCDYTKHVFAGMLVVAVIAAVSVSVLYGAGTTIAWLVAITVHGYIEDSLPMVVSAAVFMAGVAWLILYASEAFRKFRLDNGRRSPRGHKKDASDWFLPNAWRALKEKTCVRVIFNDTLPREDNHPGE